MIRKEIPLKDFITDNLYINTPQCFILEHLGFDPNRGTITWWDDPYKNVRVIVQTFPEDDMQPITPKIMILDKPFDHKDKELTFRDVGVRIIITAELLLIALLVLIIRFSW